MTTNHTRPLSLFAAAITAAKRHQSLDHFITTATRLYVVALVALHGGDTTAAARVAGVTPLTISRMWKRCRDA
jgi:hypothetical protein